MAGFTEATDYTKFLVFLLLGNLVIHIISFGSPFWTTRYDGNAGLWTGCTQGVCYERWNQWVAGWIKASQTFMTMSLITLSASTLCVFLYVFHKAFDKDKRLICLSLGTTALSAFFTFVAAVNWAANEHLKSGEVLNWPYVFAWLSAIASTAAVPFIWLELQLPNFYDRQKNGRDNVEAALQREKEMGYIGPAM